MSCELLQFDMSGCEVRISEAHCLKIIIEHDFSSCPRVHQYSVYFRVKREDRNDERLFPNEPVYDQIVKKESDMLFVIIEVKWYLPCLHEAVYMIFQLVDVGVLSANGIDDFVLRTPIICPPIFSVLSLFLYSFCPITPLLYIHSELPGRSAFGSPSSGRCSPP